MGEGLLTDLGKEVYRKKNKYFQTYCGDYFIQKALVKNVLAINVSFHTNSYDDFCRLVQGSNINILGIREALSQMSSITSQSNIQGSINFHVFQIGGSSEKLTSFLKSVDSTKSIFSQQCELGNVDSCFAFVNVLS